MKERYTTIKSVRVEAICPNCHGIMNKSNEKKHDFKLVYTYECKNCNHYEDSERVYPFINFIEE